MTAYSFRDVESFARQAGFTPELSPLMAAISFAESGGNSRAHNPNASTGDNSYGLMQINMLGAMGPERRAAFGIQSNEELFDPLTNMKAAKKIFDSQGLGAWSVYRSGAYKQFLPGNYTPATDAAAAAATQPSTTSSGQQQPSQQEKKDSDKLRMAGEITGNNGVFDVAIRNLSKLLGR